MQHTKCTPTAKFICWIEIYPLGKVINSLNDWGQYATGDKNEENNYDNQL